MNTLTKTCVMAIATAKAAEPAQADISETAVQYERDENRAQAAIARASAEDQEKTIRHGLEDV
ncbi:MAG: hypothetical protein QNK92_17350 [Amylibacter sp.]